MQTVGRAYPRAEVPMLISFPREGRASVPASRNTESDSLPEPNEKPRRIRPARGVHQIPGQATIAFGTVCTQDRMDWLATASNCDALAKIWHDDAIAWRVGLFVVMPDHLHFLAARADERCPLETWVRYW